MTSIMAQEVAKEVISKVRKGQRPVLGKIIKSKGYSDSISKSPTKVTRTDTYKEAIEPVVASMERQRQRILKELDNKDLTKERFRDLVEGMDKLTKNIQLLSGGATENITQPIANIFIKNAVQYSHQHPKDSEPTEED